MKKIIKSFKDIKYIIKNKLDIFEGNSEIHKENSLIPYNIFLTYTLKEVLKDLFDGNHYYISKN